MSAEDLVDTLERLAASDLSAHDGFDAVRPRALAAARKLCQQLETPLELSRRLGWQEPSHTVGIKIAMNMKLFEHLKGVGHDGSISSKELTTATQANEELVGRICRLLTSWGTIREVDVDQYAPTLISDGMTNPKVFSGIDIWFSHSSQATRALPDFIQQYGYEKLEIPSEGNWAKNMGDGVPMFPWMGKHPEIMRTFADHMSGFQIGRDTWVAMYPTDARLVDGADTEGPLLVDLGGGIGHDVVRFYDKHPQPPGRLFVQEIPSVVESAKKENAHPAIEFQEHDFNNPQPVEGARAYLLHHILHDWSDEICHNILSQLAKAMRSGYSKVLIGEFLVGSRNPDPFCTAMDLTVLAWVGAKERTEEAWRELISSAGMKVTGIWSSASSNGESVIEAELA